MKTQLYNLPRPMLCDVEKDLDADGFPTMKAVREYMDLHSGAIRRLKYLSELYVGRHDILRAPDKEAWKPDNRLVVNFPRYITNISLGYGYGVPITKRFPDEKVEESIQQIEKRNHIVDHENQLFKKVFQMGHAWEFFYQNENAQTRMKVLTPMQFFCVYDDTLEERSVFAVRYGRKKDGKIYGEVYTQEYQRKFLEGNWKGELEVNPYGLIPAVEYMLNDERMGLYEDSAPLIEAYNRTLSEKTNDVQGIILHHTAEPTIERSLAVLTSLEKKVGTHVVIDTDGTRYIMAEPTAVTFHAGKSILNGREGCNDFTIGIELQGNTLEQPLTIDQIDSAIEYILPLMNKYNIPVANIVTHEMIRQAYKRKYPQKRCYDKVDITQKEYKRFMARLNARLAAE